MAIKKTSKKKASKKRAERKSVMPIVFTSMLANYGDTTQKGLSVLGDVKTGISQTSQVYIDHQVWENNGELWLSWDYVDSVPIIQFPR